MHSWAFFFALVFVLALVWAAVELYHYGYSAGWKDRGYRGILIRDVQPTALQRLVQRIRS